MRLEIYRRKDMRNVLCSADFVNTDDGFFMCKKSLKGIFI